MFLAANIFLDVDPGSSLSLDIASGRNVLQLTPNLIFLFENILPA